MVSVKFVDAQAVRVTSGNQVTATSPGEAAAIASALATHGLTLAPEINLDPQVLQDIIDEAQTRSGRAQPDWFGVYRITFPSAARGARQNAVDALLALSSVEYVNLALTDIPPPGATPSFEHLQTYFSSDAMDVDHAHTLGLYGQGMTYVDVEYCWLLGHEDLILSNLPALEFGVSPDPNNPPINCWHGAATIGMLSSDPANGFGVKGMVPSAASLVNPEQLPGGVQRRPEAILSAINRTSVGDVIILEMQTRWPTDEGSRFGPAEFDLNVWNASRTAFDAGRLVMAAAGNGARNLDASKYASYRARGDSGAIIVGAGNPITREWQAFSIYGSTFGSRVNLHGWGADVTSHGYGYLFLGNGDYNRSYTDVYSGTSSATPMVAAAAMLTQQAVKANFWVPFDAMEMRELLRATGKPQGPILIDQHIGPLPDLQGSLGNLNVADAGVAVSSGTPPKAAHLEIANYGPSRATGRSVTVQLSINDVHADIRRTDTSDVSCEFSFGEACLGTCLIYECQLPELRFGQEPITLEWACDGATYNPTFTTAVALDSGNQIDPVPGNDNLVHHTSCFPTE